MTARPMGRHIGVVAQDNILFSTSIFENVTYGMGQGHLPEGARGQ
jgi:ABC-type multidrug transport system fused ATPase/permease subunit